MANAGGNGAPRPVQPLPQPPVYYFGQHTPAENQARITEAVTFLAQCGVNVGLFTVDAVNQVGMTTDQFIKAVKPLQTHAEQGVINPLFTEAIRARVFDVVMELNVQQVVNVCEWLKSRGGQNAISTVYRTRKLQAKVLPGTTAADVAWASVLQQQLSDLSGKRKEIRVEKDEAIAELRREIQRLEIEKGLDLAAIDAEMVPASMYNELNAAEIARRSFNLYTQRAALQGVVPLPRNDDGIKMAVDLFGNEVRQRHMQEFVQGEVVQQQLMQFLRGKILELDQIHERKQASTFRALLAAVGGEAITQPAVTEEAGDDGDDTGGEAQQAGGEQRQDAPEPVPARVAEVGEGSAGDQGAARAPPANRGRGRRGQRGVQAGPRKSLRRMGRGEGPSATGRQE
ncbi:ORF1p [Camellia oleifera amalgavirus 1]|uniref:ORF1p n=1 Tax=Camellia oleifera amalgavirus 1 TaxID=2069319 RepID=UPI000DC1E630|nr:ORF1p [Camellia oleifera amalgavirus 1]DAB41680.1 TPA_inf: ORF1p [Camellia oleifera amalgavirus 1]